MRQCSLPHPPISEHTVLSVPVIWEKASWTRVWIPGILASSPSSASSGIPAVPSDPEPVPNTRSVSWELLIQVLSITTQNRSLNFFVGGSHQHLWGSANTCGTPAQKWLTFFHIISGASNLGPLGRNGLLGLLAAPRCPAPETRQALFGKQRRNCTNPTLWEKRQVFMSFRRFFFFFLSFLLPGRECLCLSESQQAGCECA